MDQRLERMQLGELRNGDQIAVRGNIEQLNPALGFLHYIGIKSYFHHGIFVNDEFDKMQVIEFQGTTKQNAAPVKRDFLYDFYKGHGELFRVVYPNPQHCLPAHETVEMGRQAVANGTNWEPYNLIVNNCESFATYLKTAVVESKQASYAIARVWEAMVPLAVAAVGSAGAGSLVSGASQGSPSCTSLS